MNIKNLFSIFIVTIFFHHAQYLLMNISKIKEKCCIFLEDLPLPEDAKIIKVPTVLLGTGDAISGRIILESDYSPAENLIFYGNETPSTGWVLVSSKVSEK